MNFLDIVNHEDAKLSLILNLIEPGCGGVLLIGPKGTGKSTLLRAFTNLLKELNTPFVKIPLNATEEAILGGIDLEETIKKGRRIFQPGLLSKANGGYLIIEDINLFPQEILSIIFQVQAAQEIFIEREGFSFRAPVSFQILATMNPEEVEFSPHFLDRFGLCAFMESLKDKEKRVKIVKLNIFPKHYIIEQEDLIKKIQIGKTLLNGIEVSDEITEFITEIVLREFVSGHRADIYLYYAARALCAYLGEFRVTKDHVEAVAPLVLNHRKRFYSSSVEEHEEDHSNVQGEEKNIEEKTNKKEEEHNKSENNAGREREEVEVSISSEKFQDENLQKAKSQKASTLEKEEIFSIGESFNVKRLIFRKDRIVRTVVGRRTKTKTEGKGGRYIRSVIRVTPEIALDATLRAAAPFQNLRGKSDRVIILEEDLRYKEKERKTSHIVIFVVDGSGSMGVNERMKEAKGAIFSLLIDSYKKREKVSMIVFRKDKAEIVLPLTSSLELAKKRLEEIPTGGKTPLSAALLEAYKLIRSIMRKFPKSRILVILITDGKANVSLSGGSVLEELQKICLVLRGIPYVDYIIIDTEKKGIIRSDYAKNLALWLSAQYFSIEALKSEIISNLVKKQFEIS
ncbi:MAG: AAA family ATPase [Caldimicrobium sp.]